MLQNTRFVVLVLLCCTGCLCKTVAELRQQLNVPPEAKQVIVFGQGAHLDWDWLNVFTTNVNNTPPDYLGWYWNWDPTKTQQPTNTIFTAATNLLSSSPKYGYSIAEISFLRSFKNFNQQLFNTMLDSQRLSIVGGGLATPDSLLPHGEAFIRNYLTGLLWLKTVPFNWSGYLWLPDDFGHDSQLPIVLNALGAKGVSFSRIPGSCWQGGNPAIPAGYVSAHRTLLNESSGGLDFMWQASDGSAVYSYYMPTHYCPGENIAEGMTKEYGSVQQAVSCNPTSTPSDPIEHIEAYINVRNTLSPTPFMFVAVGCDFAMPVPSLVKQLETWNSQRYPTTGIYAVSSSFDIYGELVNAYVQENKKQLHVRSFHGSTPETSFQPTPYWMGYYASRPQLKDLHYEGTRVLIGTEVLYVLSSAFNLQNVTISQASIDSLWDEHSPSTHHDYVTGTANDYVYMTEQLPLSISVLARANAARDALSSTIAKALGNTTINPNSSSLAAVIFNQNGFPVTGVASFTVPSVQAAQILVNKYPNNVQLVHDDSSQSVSPYLITYARTPPLGYAVNSLQAGNRPFARAVARISPPGDVIMLNNEFLSAVITKDLNWGLEELIDKTSTVEDMEQVIKVGNIFEFRYDRGNIYRFGYEETCTFEKMNIAVQAENAAITENGPLRVRAEANFTVQHSLFGVQRYTLQYTLVTQEPFLRIALIGAAPSYTTVMTTFQFPDNITSYVHGTPYHFDTKTPLPYGRVPDFQVTFEAVHNFILPRRSDMTSMAAIYTKNSPAWGVIGNKLYGVLLRNTPEDRCANKGAAGSDNGVHRIEFAIRVPSSGSTKLEDPSRSPSSQALREATTFSVPLRAVLIDNPTSGVLPSNFSLATMSLPTSSIITAVKRGSFDSTKLVIRAYQPENKPQKMQVLVNNQLLKGNPSGPRASLATALEDVKEPVPCNRLNDQWTSIDLEAKTALTTISVSP